MSAKPESAARVVPCPGCRKPAVFDTSNRWRPFCSQRCREQDLGSWASERFRVAAEMPTDDEPAPPQH